MILVTYFFFILNISKKKHVFYCNVYVKYLCDSTYFFLHLSVSSAIPDGHIVLVYKVISICSVMYYNLTQVPNSSCLFNLKFQVLEEFSEINFCLVQPRPFLVKKRVFLPKWPKILASKI